MRASNQTSWNSDVSVRLASRRRAMMTGITMAIMMTRMYCITFPIGRGNSIWASGGNGNTEFFSAYLPLLRWLFPLIHVLSLEPTTLGNIAHTPHSIPIHSRSCLLGSKSAKPFTPIRGATRGSMLRLPSSVQLQRTFISSKGTYASIRIFEYNSP
jgi:hypothetical protein